VHIRSTAATPSRLRSRLSASVSLGRARDVALAARVRPYLPLIALGLLFVATRTTLLLFTVNEREFILPSVTNDVREIYISWYDVLSGGEFPHNDVRWQYPPAAALVMLAPGALPFTYATNFYLLSFLVDVAVFVLLFHAARRAGAAQWAAWVWTIGVALGGPIAYGRDDLMVTATAVAGLVLVAGRDSTAPGDRDATRRFRRGGAWLAFGALLKVWPALLLVGVGAGRRFRDAWTGAVVAGLALTAGFVVAMPGALSFLTMQGSRGVEVESIGALPFHVAAHHGWTGRVGLSYGSMEYLGPYVGLVAKICLALSVLALGWLIVWRVTVRVWRATTAADAAFVAVLLFVVTSRVISPQYMVWLVGLAAVCALHFGAGGDSVMRLPAVLVLIATALSCVEYPYFFEELLRAERDAVLLVTVRNLLLVAAALIGATRLWRSTRAVAAASVPAQVAAAPVR
jgi:hypothetical protein